MAQWITTRTGSLCKADTLPVPNGTLFPYVKNAQVYICPSDKNGKKKTLSYSMNANLDNFNTATIRNVSRTIILVDESDTLNDGFFAPPDPTSGSKYDTPSFIHTGGACILFTDNTEDKDYCSRHRLLRNHKDKRPII